MGIDDGLLPAVAILLAADTREIVRTGLRHHTFVTTALATTYR